MLKGNKGEWSEIYTLLKLLSDKKLFGGDKSLRQIENVIFPIIKILRDESHGAYEYAYNCDLVVIKGNKESVKIPISQFKAKAGFLLSKLRETTGRSFSIPEVEQFIKSFNCKSLKAKSSVKSDLRIIIHDEKLGTTPELGFSIKSQLGGSSTLLNAARTTNFIYKIDGANLTKKMINSINSISSKAKIKDRIQAIRENSGRLCFVKVENEIFSNNLILIDSELPKILSEIIHLYFTTKNSKMIDLVSCVSQLNPLGYNSDTQHPFYSYKIRRLLTEIALGMQPAEIWTGKLDATGGYLIVKGDGDIVCYHIYNTNEFEDYLIHNTRLETPSSERHKFGMLYQESGGLFFKLNLQIRFVK